MSSADLLGAGAWRVLVTDPAPGAWNMALDHALMERTRETGERVLRVYAWSRPTVSFGRHQAVRNRVDPVAVAAAGLDLVRRPTGGRALLHFREVTYSVTAPLAAHDSVRAWYGAINEVLLAGLRGLGVRADLASPTGRPPVPGTASCFVRADSGEIAVGGRKLVGSALVRLDGALLQHGSILIHDDQRLLDHVLPPGELPSERAATLSDALGRDVAMTEVCEALVAALHGAGPRVSPLSVDSLLANAVSRIQPAYGAEWTFRQ